jgi:hypothetical protein
MMVCETTVLEKVNVRVCMLACVHVYILPATIGSIAAFGDLYLKDSLT